MNDRWRDTCMLILVLALFLAGCGPFIYPPVPPMLPDFGDKPLGCQLIDLPGCPKMRF